MQDKKWIYHQVVQLMKMESMTIHYYQKQQYYFANEYCKEVILALTDLIYPVQQMVNEDPNCSWKDSLYSLYQKIRRAQEAREYIQVVDVLQQELEPIFYDVQKRLLADQMLSIDEERLQKNLQIITKEYPLLEESLFGEKISDDYAQYGALTDEHFALVVQSVQQVMEQGYEIGYADSGEIVCSIRQGEKLHQLHSFHNPSQEAIQLAAEWLKEGDDRFVCYGFGMGYVYEKMLEMNSMADILVIDGSRCITTLAVVFSDLYQLYETGRFHLLPDTTNMQIFYHMQNVGDGKACHVYEPSLLTIENGTFRQKLEEYFIEDSSVRTQSHQLLANFRRNQSLHSPSAFELQERFNGKDAYIVAAGPSLDHNIEQLRKVGEEGVILATGTVLKKMLHLGIRPDFVIITDSGERTYGQIQDLQSMGIPLLYLSTVYYEIPRDYPGDTYILYQHGLKLAENKAAVEHLPLVETGGSVSTTALDFCYQAGCRRIIFLGLDLAYTDNKSHAGDTNDACSTNGQEGIYVKDVYGNQVLTARNLNIYREWIEQYLAKKQKEGGSIPVIDATEGGALVRGTIIDSLEHVIAESSVMSECTKKKISVVVPCYNVEKWINRCMNSLVRQTIGIENLQLIFVDDASTDGTVRQLEKWEKRYPDSIIVVTCEKNGRQGTARNIGMEYVTTPYMAFVDADDWIEKEMYEKLYEKAVETDAEIVGCQCVRDTGDGVYEEQIAYDGPVDCFCQVNTVEQRKQLLKVGLSPYLTTRLFKTDYIQKHHFQFIEGKAYEDNLLGALIIYTVQSYYTMSFVGYHYFFNRESTTTSKNSIRLMDRLEIEEIKWKQLCEMGFQKDYETEMKMSFMKAYYITSVHLIFTHFEELPYELLETMRERLTEYCGDYEKDLDLSQLNSVETWLLALAKEKHSKEEWEKMQKKYLTLFQ